MFNILKILIFIRPFISSLAFFWSNLFYSIFILGFLAIWFQLKGLSIKKIKPLLYPLILFVLSLVVSIIFSLNLPKSIAQIHNYLIYILIFLLITSLSNGEKQLIIKSIILSSLIISLLAIYQYFFGLKHILNYMLKYNISYSFGADYVAQKRVFFPFVTPNTLGSFLILTMPLILDKKRLYPLFIPISLALFFTKSIGAFLSLFSGLIIYLYIMGKIDRKRFIGMVILAAIIILVFILRWQTSLETTKPYLSLNNRLYYWQETIRLIKAHPLLGVGVGNFNLSISRYAHNFILQIWAEMGILGLLTFIWFIGAHLKYILKNIRNNSDKNKIACLLSANLAFLIHNLVDFTFFIPEVCLLWWVILGASIVSNE